MAEQDQLLQVYQARDDLLYASPGVSEADGEQWKMKVQYARAFAKAVLIETVFEGEPGLIVLLSTAASTAAQKAVFKGVVQSVMPFWAYYCVEFYAQMPMSARCFPEADAVYVGTVEDALNRLDPGWVAKYAGFNPNEDDQERMRRMIFDTFKVGCFVEVLFGLSYYTFRGVDAVYKLITGTSAPASGVWMVRFSELAPYDRFDPDYPIEALRWPYSVEFGMKYFDDKAVYGNWTLIEVESLAEVWHKVPEEVLIARPQEYPYLRDGRPLGIALRDLRMAEQRRMRREYEVMARVVGQEARIRAAQEARMRSLRPLPPPRARL